MDEIDEKARAALNCLLAASYKGIDSAWFDDIDRAIDDRLKLREQLAVRERQLVELAESRLRWESRGETS